MDKQQRLQELKKLIDYYDHKYYVENESEISDAEYDALKDEYMQLGGQYNYVPGEVQNIFEKYKHIYSVKSLDKVNNEEDLIKELRRLWPVIIEPKFDGLTIVIYNNAIVTRGNGIEGENITHTGIRIKDIKFSPVQYPIRAEAIIPLSEFKKINNERVINGEEPFKNPRNAVAGMLRNKDANNVKGVKYYAYNVLGVTADDIRQLRFLKDNGFNITPFFIPKTIDEAVDFVINYDRNKLDYEIDGLVIKSLRPNSLEHFGETEHHPKNAIAYKFPSQGEWTKLKDVTWQVGRTGKVVPVAEIEPVDIMGSTITRATLHNLGIMQALNITKDCDVYVIKANDVIPAITSTKNNTEEKFDIPKHCPICNSNLELINDQLYCKNDLCDAKLYQRLVHLASRDVLNIEGLSEATIDKFISKGYVNKLTDLFSITKDMILSIEGFAEKSAIKLYENIQNARNTTLDKFIYAVGINGVGKATARLIAEELQTYENLIADINNNCSMISKINGIGDVTVKNIIKSLNNIFELKEYIDINYTDKTNKTGLKICISGTLPKERRYYEHLLEQLGHKFASSITKDTAYLIVGLDAGNSKLEKAQKYNINIINVSNMSEEEIENTIRSLS